MIVTGACCMAGSLWFTLELPKIRAVMHPIYEKMGLVSGRGVDLIGDESEPEL